MLIVGGKKRERSQISNINFYFKKLAKSEQIKPKVGQKKEVINIRMNCKQN